jgi:replicative superfamily II helicase
MEELDKVDEKLKQKFVPLKVIYVAPLKALAKERHKDWSIKLEKKLNKKVVELSGDCTPDLEELMEAEVIITTPEKWDGISRNW